GRRHLSRALPDAGARHCRNRQWTASGGDDRGDTQGHELAPVPSRTAVIAYLRGRLSAKQPNRIVIDVNGVGYDVSVPLSTFYGLGEEGGDVALRIHTHVREDALALYGFATALELVLFERLIAISGIGPKLALAVMSGIEPNELVRAIEQSDIARLTAIPGVGKKTAERIVVELKDRLPRLRPEAAAAGGDAHEPSA